MHQSDLAHTDIKPENILLTDASVLFGKSEVYMKGSQRPPSGTAAVPVMPCDNMTYCPVHYIPDLTGGVNGW